MSFMMASQVARHHLQSDPVDKLENTAVTVRPSSTAVFAIDSKDRYANILDESAGRTSPYSYQITKKESLLNGYFRRIALTEIVFPYYVPNINPRTDTILCSINGAAPVPLLIPAGGFYTPAQIAVQLDTALATAGLPGATVTYTEGRFTFNAGGGNTLAFFRGNFASPGAQLNQFQLFDLLNMNTTVNGIAAQIQTTGVTRCRYTEYIDIVCSQLTYNQELKDSTSSPIVRDVIARVYIEADDSFIQPYWNGSAEVISEQDIPGTYPFTIYRKFPHPKQIKWDKTQPIGNLRFEVYDDKGQILTTNDAVNFPDFSLPDWRMTLLVSED